MNQQFREMKRNLLGPEPNAPKYGFHFPVNNEPWHMELTTAAREAIKRENAFRATSMGKLDYMGDALSKKPQQIEVPKPNLRPEDLTYAWPLKAHVSLAGQERGEKTLKDAFVVAPGSNSYNAHTAPRAQQAHPGPVMQFSLSDKPIAPPHDRFDKTPQEVPYTPIDDDGTPELWQSMQFVSSDKPIAPPHDRFDKMPQEVPYTPIDGEETKRPWQSEVSKMGSSNWISNGSDEETLREQRLRAMQFLLDR